MGAMSGTDPERMVEMMRTLGGIGGELGREAAKAKRADAEADKARDEAWAAEQDAREAAARERDDARERAADLREQGQQRRARARAAVGATGLGMAGTPLTVADAMAEADREEVGELLADSRSEQGRILASGRASGGRKAAARRAGAVGYAAGDAARTAGSLLSLGRRYYGS